MVTKYLVRLRALAVRLIHRIVGLEPVEVLVHGSRYIVNPKTGRLLPLVAGARPDEDDDDDADAEDADADKGGAGDDDDDDADDKGGADDEDADDKGGKSEPNWKRLSRKHERERKKAEQALADANTKLQQVEDAKKTDQEKAVEAAEQKARDTAETKYESLLKEQRLEVSATKVAARGIKVRFDENGSEKEKTVRFADPDDALMYLQRDITNGDLDEDDLLDDKGKPIRTKIEEALADLYDRKPHLFEDGGKAGGDGASKKVKGGADGGKGGGDVKTPEEGSVDDHMKVIRRHKAA